MNYKDIRDTVVEVTDNLDLIPTTVLEDIIDCTFNLYGLTDILVTRVLSHPSIKLVIHAWVDTSPKHHHMVATVMVKDVPAFYFISASKESHECYALNAAACKNFVQLLVELHIDTRLEETDVEELSWLQDVPELTEFCGVKIMYRPVP